MSNYWFEEIVDIPHLPLHDKEVLFYYDGPVVGVLATNRDDLFYVYSAEKEELGVYFSWLLVLLDEDKLAGLLEGETLFRNIFVGAGEGELYRFSSEKRADGSWSNLLVELKADSLEEPSLPAPEFRFTR